MSATLSLPWPRRRVTTGALALVALAGVAWWATAARMAGMDAGPGTDLGSLGWFAVSWTLMMAAMMLPSLAPAAAGVRRPPSGHPLPLAAGYLTVWSAAGVGACLLLETGGHALGGTLAWSHGGRAAAAAVLALAALYELSAPKRACLRRCRTGLGTSFADGVRAGGWCAGCCWGLMAALFALGVMSLTWMALVAGVVLLQKVAPWPRATTAATAGILLALAVGIAASPDRVPGLVVPGASSMHHAMKAGM